MKLALGTVQFGMDYGISNQQGQISESEVSDILSTAQAHQIDMLDTASAYGNAEQVIGKLHHQRFGLITKIADKDIDVIEQIIANTMQRLNATSLYGLLLHSTEHLLSSDLSVSIAKFLSLKASEQVHKVGVSVYSPDELQAVLEVFTPDLVQLPMNVFDQRFLQSGMLQRLKDNSVEIHVRSAFLQGLLLMPEDQIPKHFSPFIEHIHYYFKQLEEKEQSKVQGALGFFHTVPQLVDRLVVGCCSTHELVEIIAAFSKPPALDYAMFASDDETLILPSHWRTRDED